MKMINNAHEIQNKCRYYSAEFDEWWKEDLLFQEWSYDYRSIDRQSLLICLIKHCKEHTNKWLNKNKMIYTQQTCFQMVVYLGDYFDLWFNKNLVIFDQYSTRNLMIMKEYVPYFKKWWDPEKLDLRNCINLFSDDDMKKFEILYKIYKHIWAKDIVMAKLSN